MTQGFDEFYSKYHNLDGYEHHYEEFYEAGAASRQGEVDELKRELEILQGMHDAQSLYAGDLVDERDELQKRVDWALHEIRVSDGYCRIGLVEEILKGKKND